MLSGPLFSSSSDLREDALRSRKSMKKRGTAMNESFESYSRQIKARYGDEQTPRCATAFASTLQPQHEDRRNKPERLHQCVRKMSGRVWRIDRTVGRNAMKEINPKNGTARGSTDAPRCATNCTSVAEQFLHRP